MTAMLRGGKNGRREHLNSLLPTAKNLDDYIAGIAKLMPVVKER